MKGIKPRLQLSDLQYVLPIMLPILAFFMLMELTDASRYEAPAPRYDEGYQDLQALLDAQGLQLPPERIRVPGAPEGCVLTVAVPGDCAEPAGGPLEGGEGTCEPTPSGWAFHLSDPGFRGTVRCASGCPTPEIVVGTPDEAVPDGVTALATHPDGTACPPPIAPPGP